MTWRKKGLVKVRMPVWPAPTPPPRTDANVFFRSYIFHSDKNAPAEAKELADHCPWVSFIQTTDDIREWWTRVSSVHSSSATPRSTWGPNTGFPSQPAGDGVTCGGKTEKVREPSVTMQVLKYSTSPELSTVKEGKQKNIYILEEDVWRRHWSVMKRSHLKEFYYREKTNKCLSRMKPSWAWGVGYASDASRRDFKGDTCCFPLSAVFHAVEPTLDVSCTTPCSSLLHLLLQV